MYIQEDHDSLYIYFAYTGDIVMGYTSVAECAFKKPFRAGEIPELMNLRIDNNFLSQDMVDRAQSAIIEWVLKSD